MAQILQVGNQQIQPDDLLPLLTRYQLLPQLVRNILIEQAIADITYTEEEYQSIITDFEKQQQIVSEEGLAAWLQNQGISIAQLEDILIRRLKIAKFKGINWGKKVNTYFLTRKAALDQVIYSLIRIQDRELAQEIYYRIHEGEQSFSDAARQYSKGEEAITGGIIGPVPLNQTPTSISKLLSVSQPGQLWSPRQFGEWFIIIKVEHFIPAQLDEIMRLRLVDELYEIWIQEQTKKYQILNYQNLFVA